MAVFSNPRYWLVRIINQLQPQMADEILKTWQKQIRNTTYVDIRDMIMASVVNQTLVDIWNLDFVELVNIELVTYIQKTIETAEKAVKGQNRTWDFDVAPKTMAEWTLSRGAELVTNVCDEQRKALQSLILLGTNSQAYTVDEIARIIRPTIGLTSRESRAIYNYYDSLRSNGMKETKAENLSAKYAEKMHRHRAMRISRTELAFAYNYSANQTIREAQNQRLIGDVEKVWISARDERVCEYCKALDGKSVAIHEPFISDGKRIMLAPRHPHCRCSIAYEETTPLDNVFIPKRKTKQEQMFVDESKTKIKKSMTFFDELKSTYGEDNIIVKHLQGMHNQKDHGRNKNTVNSVANNKNGGIIEVGNFIVPKSLGAMAKKFYVKTKKPLKDGTYYIKQGTEVTGVKVIAQGEEIREVQRLIEKYRISNNQKTKVKDWFKVRGSAIITDGKDERKAEIHWYQAENIGKVEFKEKIRGDLDED